MDADPPMGQGVVSSRRFGLGLYIINNHVPNCMRVETGKLSETEKNLYKITAGRHRAGCYGVIQVSL